MGNYNQNSKEISRYELKYGLGLNEIKFNK